MSKLIKWGRSVVAASIAFTGAQGIYDAIGHLIGARDLILIAVFVAVGWGILVWSEWAHFLLALIMALGVGVVTSVLITSGREALNWHVLGALTLYSVTVLWLLLPAVRRKYWRKEMTA
jgi:ABC-type transport system involved in multi-copper enzyme maturation permease subunit